MSAVDVDEILEHQLNANMLLMPYEVYVQLFDSVAELGDENAELREQIERLQPKDCEGNALDIADTVSMLRSEYDGDHEWDDVVVELVLTKWGGDRWIVRGSKGEAWACDCTKTGYDEDAYEGSDDVEPIDNPTLIEVENAKLRERVDTLEWLLKLTLKYAEEGELGGYELCDLCDRLGTCENHPATSCTRTFDTSSDFIRERMREMGIEVDG